jgi:hypothetical protein
MNTRLPIASMAGCFALSGFAIAIVSGLLTSNSASSILSDALLVLVVCYVVGLVVGHGAKAILTEHLRDLAKENPVPRMQQQSTATADILEFTPDQVESAEEVEPEGVAA